MVSAEQIADSLTDEQIGVMLKAQFYPAKRAGDLLDKGHGAKIAGGFLKKRHDLFIREFYPEQLTYRLTILGLEVRTILEAREANSHD